MCREVRLCVVLTLGELPNRPGAACGGILWSAAGEMVNPNSDVSDLLPPPIPRLAPPPPPPTHPCFPVYTTIPFPTPLCCLSCSCLAELLATRPISAAYVPTLLPSSSAVHSFLGALCFTTEGHNNRASKLRAVPTVVVIVVVVAVAPVAMDYRPRPLSTTGTPQLLLCFPLAHD